MTANNQYAKLDARIYNAYHPIHVYMALCLCSGGIVLNLCMIMVLAKRKMRSATNTILLSIALVEIVLMTLYLTYLLLFEFASNNCWFKWYTLATAYFNIVYADLSVVLRACSLWLTVLMARIRYRMIYKPQTRLPGTCTIVALICAVIAGVSITATPVYLLHQIKRRAIPKYVLCTTGHYYKLEISDLARSWNGVIAQITCWTNGLLFKLLPCCLLAYYLCRLGHYLYNYEGHRDRTLRSPKTLDFPSCIELNENPCYSSMLLPSATQNEQHYSTVFIKPRSPRKKRRRSGVKQLSLRSSTLILTVIMIVTLVCETPNALFSILWTIAFEWERGMEVYMNFGDVFDLFALLAAVSTFPLYCAMSSEFRKQFIHLFCTCKISNDSANDSPLQNEASMYRSFSHAV